LLTILLALIGRFIRQVDPAPRLAACRKILVVDPAFIGDMVMSTPAYRAIRGHIPGARIDAMIFEAGRPVFRNNPNVDGLHVIPRDSIVGQLRTALRLRRERFDLIINLYTGLRMNFWAWLIGAPIRTGYDYRHRGCFHNLRVPIPTRTVQTIYRPEECLILLERAFGWTIADRRMVFTVFDEDLRAAGAVLERLGCRPGEALVGFHTNAVSRREKKVWEPWKFGELADLLIERYGVRIVFTGGPGDRDHVAGIVALVRNRERTASAAGETDLSQLGAMLTRFALFVTLDTGPLHIAVAVDTPTLGLVGGVPFDIVIPPRHPRFRGLSARPARVYGMEPVAGLSVREVADAVESMRAELNLFDARGVTTGRGSTH